MLRKILIALAALAVAFVVFSLGAIWYVGAWGALFPSSDHDTEPPTLPSQLDAPAILVFTKTNGFRHVDAIAAGVPLIQEIANRRGWSVFHTENGAVFNDEQLARFAAVVFHNASGDLLDEAQEDAFKRFLENGGGWFGTHAAGDGSHESWSWYVDSLIGAPYVAHILDPQFQEATVRIEDAAHPATAKLPLQWPHTEEWYSWEMSPRMSGMRILATVDESTYEPVARMFGTETDLRMNDHPILWSQCIGRGRTIYSALGHRKEAYAVPEVQKIFEGAIAWAARMEGEGCD